MNKIRECRKKIGITMKTLGDKLGFSEAAISQYENGKRQPDIDTSEHTCLQIVIKIIEA